jgi:RimJ/RimL family protein N-acetyltransferase
VIPETIHTDRLDLIPMTMDFMRHSLDGDITGAGEALGIILPAGWPESAADLLALRLGQLETDPSLQPWLLRAMKHRETGLMIGHIGCHTGPGADYLIPFSPGGVEFGFTVFPEFRRQGYAREASIALMSWARQFQDVTNFVLSIRTDNIPSQALAAQLGFVRIGSQIDEVDGLEDVLEYRIAD